MATPKFIHRLIVDPPPRFVFELSEAGIAVARGRPPQIGFQPLEADVLSVSPVRDNVLRMDALSDSVGALAPRGEKKRQKAVLILPDFSVRVSVLDFDAFPADPQEQRSLVRFRLRKSLPFDMESAGLSYHPQQNAANGKRWDVIVAVAPIEVLARYEAPFRAAGFHPGLVTTSGLCAMRLVGGTGVSILAKVSGRTLTLGVVRAGVLKLLRTLETSGGAAEIASHLYPTFAYIEDQLAAKPERVFVCGLGGADQEGLRAEMQEQAGLPVEPLRSRFGVPNQCNAGLLGYLESNEDFS